MISFDVFELFLQFQFPGSSLNVNVNTVYKDVAVSPVPIKSDTFCQAVQIFLIWKVLQRR